jgi:hypothetical protein
MRLRAIGTRLCCAGTSGLVLSFTGGSAAIPARIAANIAKLAEPR